MEKMMMREVRMKMATLVMALIVAMLAGSAALAQDVSTNSMPGTDFSKFHTYKWITIEGAKYPNQIVNQQIQDAVNSQLSAKGLTLTTAENADLDVGYQVAVQQQQEWNAYGTGGYRWGGGMASAQSSTINIGTL